jgi:EmrB/QacA subfamily drug resistance transporter
VSRPTAPLLILLTGSAGCAMTVLDTNIVAIVLPGIARDLNATFADIEWMVSAYVLCFAALLLPAGSIADRFGRRRAFLGGIALFTAASLLCGLAPTAVALYCARAAQGMGAAFLVASALAIIGHSFHEEAERGRAWAIWGAVMGLTMVASPILGGVIARTLGWRWAFLVNIPICATLAAAVWGLVAESRDAEARRLDPAGILLFSLAMLGLTWGLISGQAHGWGDPATLLPFLGGLAALAGFLAVETRQARPMLDLHLFRRPRFVGAVIAMFAYAGAAQVMTSLLPLYLQNGLGRTALDAGFAMLPFAGAMLLLPQAGRWLGRHLASYQILVLGLAVVSAGNLLTGWAAMHGSWPGVLAGMATLGSGGGLLNGETQKAIMGSVPRERAGMASGISTTARFSGILLGFTGLSAVLAGVTRTLLTREPCGQSAAACSQALRFADAIVSGDTTGVMSGLSADARVMALHKAQGGYAQGFSAALYTAAAAAGAAAILVAVLMRPRLVSTASAMTAPASPSRPAEPIK